MLNISINLGQLIRAKGLDLLAVIHLRFTRLVTWKTQKYGGNRPFIHQLGPMKLHEVFAYYTGYRIILY